MTRPHEVATTVLPRHRHDAPTTMLPVVPQAAPRRARRWQDFSLLIGAGIGATLLGPFLWLLDLL